MSLRIRRSKAISGILLGAVFILVMYKVSRSVPGDQVEVQESARVVDLNTLENKLKGLEHAIEGNERMMSALQESISNLEKHQDSLDKESNAIRSKGHSAVTKTFAVIHKADYKFAQESCSATNLTTLGLYEEIPFENRDGGVWKQGWALTYSQGDFQANKLRVFVVPHSHNDPGWIKTLDVYYREQTVHILDNIVPKLSVDPRRKFIWAEISYFSMWWTGQSEDTRSQILKLIENGQFEIVTGGWVMNDEANTYLGAMIEQQILGHEWCKNHLRGYQPTFGWAIDPFGMSPTMAYLLKRMGFEGMLIQRTHYEIKKHLAKDQNLEFRWRQHWDHESSTDILTHMMPFYSYDIPHTCGPEPKVCCQFDFDRLPGMRTSCPWKVPPVPITDDNVAERAALLVDQYKKKAQLYKTNIVLIPLGDDFRYDKAREWDKQFDNYQKIFDYVNQNQEMNAELQFGTLGDYFNAVRSESKRRSGKSDGLFPTLSGDFFTYADINDNYWSGYYTSRPFYKNFDRVLGGYLRAAEIMFSMAWAEMGYSNSNVKTIGHPLMNLIVGARQSYSLFQHHDGVTGTAKKHVMEDYGKRMSSSINDLQTVMSQLSHFLLTPNKAFYDSSSNKQIWFEFSEKADSFKSLFSPRVLDTSGYEKSLIALFNSHGRVTSELITIRITNPNIRLYTLNFVEGDEEEEDIPFQISPIFDAQHEILNNEFLLSFVVEVPALALKAYYVNELKAEEGTNPGMDVASVRLYNTVRQPFRVKPFNDIGVFPKGAKFNFENGYVRAHFDENGLLEALTTLEDKVKTDVRLSFVQYSTRNRGEKSGAYLFLPSGPARTFRVESPVVEIVEGKLLSTVTVFFPHVTHTVKVVSSPGVDGTGLLIDNVVDMRSYNNLEVALRLDAAIDSASDFYTDLNGFSMIRRKRQSKIPLQANFYPLASMAYISDASSRLTLISRQPLGGSSLESGQLEVMLDRRLMQDDNRGLNEPVTDNLLTRSTFALLLERNIPSCKGENPTAGASYPSLLALALRHSLLNPLHTLFFSGEKAKAAGLSSSYSNVEKDLPCDIHIMNLRTSVNVANTPTDSSALIVHRQGFNACYKPVGMTCSTNEGKLSMSELFPNIFSNNVQQKTLSLLYNGMNVEKSFTVSIKPMEMYTFVLKH